MTGIAAFMLLPHTSTETANAKDQRPAARRVLSIAFLADVGQERPRPAALLDRDRLGQSEESNWDGIELGRS